MALLNTHDLDGPLRQGDLLRGLTLYVSGAEGEPKPSECEMGLVVSRNCLASRAESVLVAGILRYRGEQFTKIDKDEPSLGELRRRFAALRDGDGQPDRFYLGTLPGENGARFAARMDLVYTIEVPTRDAERQQWIGTRRFARLSEEHRRHLHNRLFVAIANEGFDDFRWWADDDLEMVVLTGKKEVSDAESNLHQANMQLLKLGTDDKERRGVEKRKQNAEKRLQTGRDALRPYEEELARRRGRE